MMAATRTNSDGPHPRVAVEIFLDTMERFGINVSQLADRERPAQPPPREGGAVLIYVVNEATLVSNSDAYDMCLAVNRQLREHVAPAWGLAAPCLQFVTSTPVEPGTAALGILDDADQADDLGWHAETTAGVVYGRVFARPVLDNGGNALTNPLSVASVLSHEAIEVVLDPACNLWADAGNGTSYAQEGCDAVESDSYRVTLSAGDTTVTAMVSDFLLPAWFDPQAPKGVPRDYMGLLKAPFQVRPTGYTLTRQRGRVSLVTGRRYPGWRRAAKAYPIARTARRAHQGVRGESGPGHGHGKPD